jgi:hypothetical protein
MVLDVVWQLVEPPLAELIMTVVACHPEAPPLGSFLSQDAEAGLPADLRHAGSQ